MALLIALLLTLALIAACTGGGAPAADAPPESDTATEAVETPAAVTDGEVATMAPAESGDTATNSEPVAMATPVPPGTRAGDLEVADRAGMYTAAPEMVIDPEKYYYATFDIADKGEIRVQLFADRAPVTVNNFVYLAREGYYDGTQFHRVLADFMAQGGDPTGTGSGGPGYMFEDEIVPGLGFDRAGLLAMANAGPGTNGSQFFLTFGPTEWLTGAHTIFGEIVEGQEVLSALTLRDPNESPDFIGDILTSVTIEESDESLLPTPTPAPPTPTPFAPSALDAADRPLAEVPPAERVSYFSAEPEMTLVEGVTYTATVETAKGDIVFALDAVNAPVAVNNFVTLANLGFFDGTPVNQVAPGELMIIGSPDNNLDLPSDVGYMFVPEVALPTTPLTGSVAYAPMQPGADGIQTSGSILMIALAPPPVESGANYGFFAQMVEGDDVLAELV
ncbi:MAG: peptidylprolyl isomerase, partial [Caldilineaceae bacterium]